MASSQRKNWGAVIPNEFFIKAMAAVILCAGSVVFAQAQGAQPNNADAPWTATTQITSDYAAPSRMTESHAVSGNGSVDKLRVEELGTNGQYLPDYETEKETTQLDATTTRTVERTYQWDVNGQRNLVKVTEETRNSASGDSQVIRTTSSTDPEGNLQVIQRDIADTQETDMGTQETKTTQYLLGVNGALAPNLETQELQMRSAEGIVEATTSTLAQDSSGIWRVGEVRESTVKEEGKNRTSQESVSNVDTEGRLTEISRTVGTETENAAGEESSTVDAYSMELPGFALDGSLHLNRRVTTVQNEDAEGKTTEQSVEQPNLVDPDAGLQVSRETKSTVQYSVSGTQETQTILVRDANGALNVAWVETRESDEVPPGGTQIAASGEPQ